MQIPIICIVVRVFCGLLRPDDKVAAYLDVVRQTNNETETRKRKNTIMKKNIKTKNAKHVLYLGDWGFTTGPIIVPLALLGWVGGCTVIFSALFTMGDFLYGRLNYALPLLGVFLISGLVLLHVVSTLWSDQDLEPKGEEPDVTDSTVNKS